MPNKLESFVDEKLVPRFHVSGVLDEGEVQQRIYDEFHGMTREERIALLEDEFTFMVGANVEDQANYMTTISLDHMADFRRILNKTKVLS